MRTHIHCWPHLMQVFLRIVLTVNNTVFTHNNETGQTEYDTNVNVAK